MSEAFLPCEPAFRHEAFFYADVASFVDGAAGFITEGLEAHQPVLVLMNGLKMQLLRRALGKEAMRVSFADMARLGKNPARIIPAWRAFVDRSRHFDQGLRGIGEPVWPERTSAELVECHNHESLLNTAFGDAPPWWLLCPYDTVALPDSVIADALRTHPFVWKESVHERSDRYGGAGEAEHVFGSTLPAPAGAVCEMPFGMGSLDGLRRFVAAYAGVLPMKPARVDELVVAANEVATNSLRHAAGGKGELRVWLDGEHVVCEIRDDGRIDDLLVGRHVPDVAQESGRGLWLVNQLCELAQIRSGQGGTTVRMYFRLD